MGARQCSYYSEEILHQILPAIVKHQYSSGLAQGVDSLCHRLTITGQRDTIGVIGNGLDVFYPSFNQKLQIKMAQKYLIISEFPLGTAPQAFHFPMRNRIIAVLCDTLLVTEAKRKSGSLIMANLALENNWNVLAVPSKISAPLSVGCNLLIQEGAKPVLNANDVLEEFGYEVQL